MLKHRIVDLQKEDNVKEEVLLANERFRKLLQFRETLPVPTVAAEVIGQDPSSWFRSLTINKGETEGVRKGMAVISPEGVVGQILKAAPHYATVLLITDYNSAVDSIVQKTRARAIVEGKGENRCQLKYLLRAEEVSAGDVVVTSGLSGNFPKGASHRRDSRSGEERPRRLPVCGIGPQRGSHQTGGGPGHHRYGLPLS